MPKRKIVTNPEVHEMYRDLVDTVELGLPIRSTPHSRAVMTQVTRLAVAGAENAKAQLGMPEVLADAGTVHHLVALLEVNDALGWLGDDREVALTYQGNAFEGYSTMPEVVAMGPATHYATDMLQSRTSTIF